ncbi:hypothetical protein CHUAL_013136 [Chamberlinius hualienensis]
MPEPRGLPLIGHLHLINRQELHQTLYNWACKYGSVYKIRLGQMPVVVISDPVLIKYVFERTSVSEKPPLFITDIMGGCGIIAASGDSWREQRQLVQSAMFGLMSFKEQPLIDTIIIHEVNHLLKKIEDTTQTAFDPGRLITMSVSHLMEKAILGKSFEDPEDVIFRGIHLRDRASSCVHLTSWLNYFPFLRFLPGFRHFYKRLKSMEESSNIHLNKILEEQLRNNEEIVGFIDFYIGAMEYEYRDFINQEIRKQTLSSLADVFEMSVKPISFTITWALYHLMERPDIQTKIKKELHLVVGKERNPTFDDKVNLPFTCACILEIQRLSSVTPLGLPHWTQNEIPIGAYKILKNTMVIGLQYAAHMHPHFWAIPFQFMPERFLDSTQQHVSIPPQFMSYSVGQRKCSGKLLAEKCLFVIISNIIHKFKIIPDSDGRQEYRKCGGIYNYPPKFLIRAIKL